MAIQFNKSILDSLLAPEIGNLTSVDIPDISEAHSQAPHWMANHFLNMALGGRYSDDATRQFSIIFLFRAQTAFEAYGKARAETIRCLEKSAPNHPAVSIYFRALAQWELAIWSAQICIELVESRIDYERDDTDQLIHGMGNRIKHAGDDIRKGQYDPFQTVPITIVNDGLKSKYGTLTYRQLADHMLALAEAAEQIQKNGTRRNEAGA